MSHRDLTSNSPQVVVELLDDSIQNPFQDDRNPLGGESSLAQSDEELNPSFNAYNGYYSKQGTTSNLISNSSSYDDKRNKLGTSLSSQGLAVVAAGNTLYAPEYDRYSSHLGSRVVSSTSLNSHFYREGLPLNSDPLLLSHQDFSPFGGYPASLFPLHIDEKEPDDYLHNPDPIEDANYDKNRFWHDLKLLDKRSLGGLVGIIVLVISALLVFILVPVLTYSGVTNPYKPETYEVLTQYLYPMLSAVRTSLIDPDTPEDEYTHKSRFGDEWNLAFSDEFNAEGRTFYDGDDQFFQAVDIHYDATKDLEWYDPDAITTANGTLNIRMDAYKNHDLFYRSGMLQSWNKMCYTNGLLLISARLPNYGSVSGLWPGLWTMGNLGRPGYLSTTDGVWPYTYDSCDAGITANQSSPDGLSYLPGQRLNKCTCDGQDHPNRGTGRGAPEIDVLEGAVDTTIYQGVASQSLQIAPMDIWYYPDYGFMLIHDPDVTSMNTYTGGPFQQAVSATTTLNTKWYEHGPGGASFQIYGVEHVGADDGYVAWYVGDSTPTLTMHAYALAPNGNVGWRLVPREPMTIIMNMGLSNNWAYIDWPSIVFPATMRIDWVRLYQPDGSETGCDPEDYPTLEYIENHPKAYQNVNFTSWKLAGYLTPKNSLVHGC